eukprot:3332019-Prymnesium_polylepis.2
MSKSGTELGAPVASLPGRVASLSADLACSNASAARSSTCARVNKGRCATASALACVVAGPALVSAQHLEHWTG